MKNFFIEIVIPIIKFFLVQAGMLYRSCYIDASTNKVAL